VVLVYPEIPPNTGNIARTCAAAGIKLHLVQPLGFSLDDRYLKRAGVDYWHLVSYAVHESWDAVCRALRDEGPWHYFTSHGGTRYDQVHYGPGDVLVFGQESTGLPAEILDAHPERRRVIPMRASGVRSLNLSNAVAIAVYEALRQQGYPFSN
jgi:tRNA (cytidine/uridine-2'-O-)-methyltransferase